MFSTSDEQHKKRSVIPAANGEEVITQADVRKTYRFYAPIYDRLFGAVLEPGRRELSREVALLKPTKLLEIGVGTGLLLHRYPTTTEITGIDISDEMLEVARGRVRHLPHSNIRLEAMDAEQLSFVDGYFDCVVVPYVLSVTPNPVLLLNELKRVCQKNGTIMILNHFSGTSIWYLLEKLVKNFAKKIGFRSNFSYEKNILENHFNVIKLKKVNIFGLSKLILIKND